MVLIRKFWRHVKICNGTQNQTLLSITLMPPPTVFPTSIKAKLGNQSFNLGDHVRYELILNPLILQELGPFFMI